MARSSSAFTADGRGWDTHQRHRPPSRRTGTVEAPDCSFVVFVYDAALNPESYRFLRAFKACPALGRSFRRTIPKPADRDQRCRSSAGRSREDSIGSGSRQGGNGTGITRVRGSNVVWRCRPAGTKRVESTDWRASHRHSRNDDRRRGRPYRHGHTRTRRVPKVAARIDDGASSTTNTFRSWLCPSQANQTSNLNMEVLTSHTFWRQPTSASLQWPQRRLLCTWQNSSPPL